MCEYKLKKTIKTIKVLLRLIRTRNYRQVLCEDWRPGRWEGAVRRKDRCWGHLVLCCGNPTLIREQSHMNHITGPSEYTSLDVLSPLHKNHDSPQLNYLRCLQDKTRWLNMGVFTDSLPCPQCPMPCPCRVPAVRSWQPVTSHCRAPIIPLSGWVSKQWVVISIVFRYQTSVITSDIDDAMIISNKISIRFFHNAFK